VNHAEPLRGYAAFDRVFNGGRKLSGALTTCLYLLDYTEKASLNIGYAVSSRRFNAVRRNRLRRMMREAVRQECAPLFDALMRHSVSASLVLVFRAHPNADVRCLPLSSFRQDIAGLFRRLAEKLGEVSHA